MHEKLSDCVEVLICYLIALQLSKDMRLFIQIQQ